MMVTRFEALKAVDDIFNYCEEIDNSLPENERSGYKMLPDIHKIRKYIIENTRQHGEWKRCLDNSKHWVWKCKCGWTERIATNFCPDCGADMRPKEGEAE